MRLRTRLSLAVALVTLVLVATFGIMFDHFLRQSVNGSIDDSLTNRATEIASALRSAPGGTPDDNVVAIVGQQSLAQVLDPDGRVAASSGSLTSRSLLSRTHLARALRGPDAFDRRVGTAPNIDAYRVLALPVAQPSGTWIVVVGNSVEVTEVALHRAHVGIIVGGTVALIVASLGAWLLSGAALRPVERMRREVAQVSEQDEPIDIAVPDTHDELARLASTMNDILTRLHKARTRDRRLVADASHELRTPLAVLRTELELAAKPGRSAQELTESVVHAAFEADRLNRLAEDLLFLARSDEGSPPALVPDLSLASLLADAAHAAHTRAHAAGVEVAVQADADAVAYGDPAAVRRAVDNLIDNALRVAPRSSRIELTAHRHGSSVTVAVLDEGPGFPPEFLPRAFERFSRGDATRGSERGGAGLGLAIVEAIARVHRGRAIAENRSPRGACVRIELPAGNAAPAELPAGALGTPAPRS